MVWTYDLLNDDTTLNLNGNTDYSVLQQGFSAPPPRRRLSQAGNIFRHGADLLERRYDNRRVVVPLRIRSTSQDDLITNINAIQALLERGAEFATRGLGSQLKLRRQWDGATNSVDFHVLEGILSLPEAGAMHAVNTEMIPARLELLCQPFAFGSAETIENFVDDPGFEVAGTALADWTESITATGTTARDTSVKKHGAASLKLVMTNSAGTGEIVERNQTLTDIDAAEVWSYQCWVRIDALSNCKVVFEVDYTGGTPDITVESTTVGASAFVKLTLSNKTAPSSTTAAVIRCRLESTAASATGTVYFDSILVVLASSVPTAWVSGRNVRNHFDDDGQAHINYLDLEDIPGDVPALLQVKAAEDENHTKFWMGARYAGRQLDAGIFHEGEAFGTWPSEPSDGSPSGGNYGETGPSLDVDAVSSGDGGPGTSLTVSHTCTGSNRILVVVVSARGNASNERVPSGVTYAGAAMTSLGGVTNDKYRVSFWAKVAPATGANNIVASFAATFTDCILGGVSFTGALQSNPSAPNTASGTSTAPSVAVTATDGAYIVDGLVAEGTVTATVHSSQTQRWNRGAPNANTRGTGSTERATSTSVTMSWTLSVSKIWAIAGVTVKRLATALSVAAADPTIQSKSISTPPKGLYRVLARARRTATDEAHYLGIGYSYGDITKDPSVQADYQAMSGSTFAIYDLGSLTIPPVSTPAGSTIGNFTLRLAMYADGDGTTATRLEVDWVMLLPVDFGSVFASKTAATDVVLVDSRSAFKGITLLDSSDVVQSVPADQLGRPPELHPDGTRLYFVFEEAGGAAIDLNAQMSVTYVPRFLQVAPA